MAVDREPWEPLDLAVAGAPSGRGRGDRRTPLHLARGLVAPPDGPGVVVPARRGQARRLRSPGLRPGLREPAGVRAGRGRSGRARKDADAVPVAALAGCRDPGRAAPRAGCGCSLSGRDEDARYELYALDRRIDELERRARRSTRRPTPASRERLRDEEERLRPMRAKLYHALAASRNEQEEGAAMNCCDRPAARRALRARTRRAHLRDPAQGAARHEVSIADFVEERVTAAPHRLAILFEGRKVTNAELDAEANRVRELGAVDRGGARRRRGAADRQPARAPDRPDRARQARRGLRADQPPPARPRARPLRVGGRVRVRDRPQRVRRRVAERAAPPREAAARVRARRSGRARRAARRRRSPRPRPMRSIPGVRAGLVAGDPFSTSTRAAPRACPKAARISHLRGMQIGGGAIGSLGLGPDDRMYVPLPLYHSAGGAMAIGRLRCSRAPRR